MFVSKRPRPCSVRPDPLERIAPIDDRKVCWRRTATLCRPHS